MIRISELKSCREHLEGIRGVVFDLDDTLFSEKDYVKSGYRAVARAFDSPQMEARLWEAFLLGKRAIDAVLEEDGRLTPEFRKKALFAYRFHTPEIELYPGTRELLEELKQNCRLGLVTDGRSEGQRAKIAALGIEELFDPIFVTDEFGGIEWRKPNPRAFEEVQKKWDIPFREMAYVGDNPNKDFIAPQALGMRAIYFQNPDGLYSKK